MRKFKRGIWRSVVAAGAVACAVALSGCAPTVAARVTSFQHWPTGVEGQTYQFVDAGPAQSNNLEHRTYQDMIRAGIGATGLTEVRAGVPARFDVSFTYGATQTQIVTRQPYDPYFYGGYGGYRPFGGYGGFGRPGWGWGGYWGPEWVDVPVTVFRNGLSLRINDRQNGGAEVYRSTASTLSDRPDVLRAMPYLVRSIFDNFPGNNGSERVIEFETQ